MKWHEIAAVDAVDIRLPHEGIEGPFVDPALREQVGQDECPWPWDPVQLKGAPLGQYHCPYCGSMVVAGMDHVDYRGDD